MATYFSIFDDTTLPGVLTHIDQSYNYGFYTNEWGTTDSVLVIGTAFSGPTNQITRIYSPEHALYVFGGSYDSKNRKEASLVTGIQDVYDRGCRSIYAIRVSGKQIYKDFELAPNLPYKLRVNGIFPSNSNKNVYMYIDKTPGAYAVNIYKPVSKATIYEKKTGVIESDDGLIVNRIDLTNTYGFDDGTTLKNFVDLVNGFSNNNVLRLSIVDENGEDVTNSDQFAASLPFESIFEGVYFIGRDVSVTNHLFTTINYGVAADDDFWKDQVGVTTFKTLALNTDVSAPYPINGTYNDLRTAFSAVASLSKFDFLTDIDSVDSIFKKDNVDYEEVDLSDFELYKKLGSGYAITAKIELKNPDIQNPTDKDFIVKETPSGDQNRIRAIKDGVYSTLENLPATYRVLMDGQAKTVISGKLPSKDEFLHIVPGGLTYIENGVGTEMISVAYRVNGLTKVNEDEFNLQIKVINDGDVPTPAELTGAYSTKAVTAIPVVGSTGDIPDDYASVIAVKTPGEEENPPTYALYKGKVALGVSNTEYNNAYFYGSDNSILQFKTSPLGTTAIDSTAWKSANNDKAYLFVDFDGNPVLFDYTTELTPVGGLTEVFDATNPGIYTVGAVDVGTKTFKIFVTESYVASTELNSFIADLNNSQLGKILSFDITGEFMSYGSTYLGHEDIDLSDHVTDAVLIAKKEYNTNLYIPYRTTDNFARQLAQHCSYTSLKTGSTHGIIGYDKISNTSLNAIANKVEEAANKDYDMYAKKDNGVNIRDRNNMPYDIGKDVSIVFAAYYVTSPDGYNYISNGAAGYAGMVSALPLDTSSTNQTIVLTNMLFELSAYQLERLTLKGYVTFKTSYTKGIVVTDGITMAQPSSEYKRLSTTRTVNYVSFLIRAAVEPFVGKKNNLATRSAMHTAIKSALNKIKNVLISDFSFVISADQAMQKLGIIDIDYTIVPLYEIRQIRNRITIRDSLTVNS